MKNLENITKGTKLKLNINGVTRVYEVRFVENGLYSLFNKFVITAKFDINFIKEHLVD